MSGQFKETRCEALPHQLRQRQSLADERHRGRDNHQRRAATGFDVMQARAWQVYIAESGLRRDEVILVKRCRANCHEHQYRPKLR